MTISNTKARDPASVSWIPAHPVYGAISMRRYWQELDQSRRPGDPFSIRSVLKPEDEVIPRGLAGSAKRYWYRKFGYPALIRRQSIGEIAHVLDHSWADMLPHLPAVTLKVVTVHDLIPLWYPGELNEAQAARFKSWVEHVKDADAVVAVSEYTKGEIRRFLNIPDERIHVVPNGVNLPANPSDSSPLELPGNSDNFLNVGSIGSTILRKNLGILPAAFAKYAETGGKRLRLIRVGAALPASLAAELREVLGAEGLVELGHLNDADVRRFYQSMAVIAVPSLSEGFGLPVLEALAHGTPVISSNTTSLPEVGGEEALYFDPHAPAELAARLEDLALKGMPEGWRDRALARAAAFSWRASLEGVFSVYQKSLERRNPRIG